MSVQLVDARPHTLRHVYPDPAGTVTVLGRTYGASWLTSSPLPIATDFVEAGCTHRLGDSGEASITFPNTTDPDGVPWKTRFSTDGQLEFVEMYRDDRLEFVMSVERIDTDRGQVTVSGHDAAFLLKRCFERDRHWTAAPHEVITAYTRVPVPLFADDFDGASVDPAWSTSGTGTVAASVSGGRLTLSSTADYASLYRVTYPSSTSWRWVTVLRSLTASGVGGSKFVEWRVSTDAFTGADSPELYVRLFGGVVGGTGDGDISVTTTDGTSQVAKTLKKGSLSNLLPATVIIERQDRWLYVYVNGELIQLTHYFTRGGVDTISLRAATTNSNGASAVFDLTYLTELQPFLARGADRGSYVLPGDYPTGGLRGRYVPHTDLQGGSVAERRFRALTPDREVASERLDPIIDTSGGLTIPADGLNAEFWAVRWFGAVYLRADQGDYTFELASVDDGARLWVGKTAFGDALIDSWTTGGTASAVWDASDHGGQAGWYPIVVEYYNDTGTRTVRLLFTPPAGGYTDPGGTAIAASTKIAVPTTSLSPLGCYDNRVQGQQHFDLVFGAAAAAGYQLVCEPMTLESGEFPGRLVPRVRVGVDTDVVLQIDDDDTVEPLFDPGVTVDSTDQATVLIGSAAGLAESRGAQVSAEVADLAGAGASLFATEAYVDSGEIAFPSLLEARLNAELALRGSPWQEVRGTPRGQERLADTFPLSGDLAAMLWRPGDGVRISVPSIGVEDTEPRQLVQVGRTCVPHGRTGTTVAFRQRPRSAEENLRRLIRGATVRGRAYQGQIVVLPAVWAESASLAASAYTPYCFIPLLASDRVIRAVVRIVSNQTPVNLGIEVNGTTRTSDLSGPWSLVPTPIDITAYASPASTADQRLYVRLQNTSAGASGVVQFQTIVEVLR